MARLAANVAAALLALAVTAEGAGAQELATLHVVAFKLSTDRTRVRVGERFHVTVAARVAERIANLDNVTLPNLSGFEELADERRCSATAGGTTCSETLTLDALGPGKQTIAAAGLIAVDGRTGRPSRFGTGTVEIEVVPTAAIRVAAVRETLYSLAADVLRLALLALFLSVGAFGLWWLRERRKAKPRYEDAPSPPIGPADAQPDFPQLVAALAREPTRARARAVRQALRARAAARTGETLADLMARDAWPGGPPGAALAAIERAAFCSEPELPQAIDEALPYLR